jgi:hypothetical protein
MGGDTERSKQRAELSEQSFARAREREAGGRMGQARRHGLIHRRTAEARQAARDEKKRKDEEEKEKLDALRVRCCSALRGMSVDDLYEQIKVFKVVDGLDIKLTADTKSKNKLTMLLFLAQLLVDKYGKEEALDVSNDELRAMANLKGKGTGAEKQKPTKEWSLDSILYARMGASARQYLDLRLQLLRRENVANALIAERMQDTGNLPENLMAVLYSRQLYGDDGRSRPQTTPLPLLSTAEAFHCPKCNIWGSAAAGPNSGARKFGATSYVRQVSCEALQMAGDDAFQAFALMLAVDDEPDPTLQLVCRACKHQPLRLSCTAAPLQAELPPLLALELPDRNSRRACHYAGGACVDAAETHELSVRLHSGQVVHAHTVSAAGPRAV